jgi:hypothetical protein
MEYFSSPVDECIVFLLTTGVKGSLVAGVSWNATVFSVSPRSLACPLDIVFLSSTAHQCSLGRLICFGAPERA